MKNSITHTDQDFKRSLSLFCVIPLLFSLSLFLVGCKKFTKDIADAKKPSDAPQYTVEYNKNISPAHGQARKPTN